MGSSYKYDAFISYRHTELDKFVAENLHKQLEAFRLPKSIAKRHKGEKNKIERVFRDKEELPLTSNLEDPIVQALENSEWLIVICSPRLRESMWCKKEIETFVKLRGRERVLAVLIEGEPADSFPDELLFRTEKRTLPDGTVEEVKIPVEPLAADVRGKTKKEVLKAMKTEVLRLLAAMFRLNYDDLRQRHRERRMRRILTASLIGGAACLLFGIYSTATALRIHRQNEQISAQSEEIKKQSDEISKQNAELALRQARSLAELAGSYLEDGNRAAAIATATEALTESEGIALPYTPEAQMILTESVRAYDTGNVMRAEYQYETAGKIESVKASPSGKVVCIYDNTYTLTVFDLEKKEEILILTKEEYDSGGDYNCTFLGKDKFVYINSSDQLCIYDLNKEMIIKQIEQMDFTTGLHVDTEGNYLIVENWDNTFSIYDGNTLENIGTTPRVENTGYVKGPYFSKDGLLACAYSVEGGLADAVYELHFIDLNTCEIISTYNMGNKEIKDIVMKNGNAYIASGLYQNYYMTCDAYASAIAINTGATIWEYKQIGYFPTHIKFPANADATDLLFITSENSVRLDIENGSVNDVTTLPSEVVRAYVYDDSNDFLLYCENGEMIVVSAEYNQSYFDMSQYFECKTQNNEEILHSPYGTIVLARNDNKITVYTKEIGSNMISIDTEVSYPEQKQEIIGEEAKEIAKAYNLERPEYVSYLFYSEDKNYCFIYYWDYDLVIYDVKQSKICNVMENVYSVKWHLGKDAEGYHYLLGYYGCYVLNENMYPIMWLSEAVAVDIETRKVIFEGTNQYFEAPIYNIDELIKIAKSKIEPSS